MTSKTIADRYICANIAMHWHSTLGLTVFALVWLRVMLRLVGTTPTIVLAPPVWQEKLAKAVHLALYLLMVVTPLVGWALLTARGRVIPFYGLYLPDLPLPAMAQARLVKEVHELLGNLGYALIGGHAAAALFHHYWVRDNTLRRMWFR
jgi:cytochrome b561